MIETKFFLFVFRLTDLVCITIIMVAVLIIYVGIRRKNPATASSSEIAARGDLIRAIENQMKMIESIRKSDS